MNGSHCHFFRNGFELSDILIYASAYLQCISDLSKFIFYHTLALFSFFIALE